PPPRRSRRQPIDPPHAGPERIAPCSAESASPGPNPPRSRFLEGPRGPRAGGACSDRSGRLTTTIYNRMVVSMQTIVGDFDRAFGALADATRRDIVRRAI